MCVVGQTAPAGARNQSGLDVPGWFGRQIDRELHDQHDDERFEEAQARHAAKRRQRRAEALLDKRGQQSRDALKAMALLQ